MATARDARQGDDLPAKAKGVVIVHPGAAASCGACAESFSSAADLRAHWKSERHLYNMRHRGRYLFQPLSQRAWDIEHDRLQSPSATAAKEEIEDRAASSCSLSSGSDDVDSEFSGTSQRSVREGEVEHASPDLTVSGSLVLPGGLVAECRERWRGHQRGGRRCQISPEVRRGSVASLKATMRSGNFADIQAVLARREAERSEWVGTVLGAQARQEHTPRLRLDVVAKGFYDGGSKTNNERGDACRGQGKRHQNAPVHAQPKRRGGRLPKWA